MNQLIAHEIFGVVGEIKECCDIPMPSTAAAVRATIYIDQYAD